MKKQYKLLNMHCAGCADALEQKLKTLDGVKAVQVNFITKILTFEPERGVDVNELSERVCNAVVKFDRMIKIENPEDEETVKEKKAKQVKMWLILSSAVLFLAAFILDKTGANFWVSLGFYIAAYALSGFEILWASAVNIAHGKIFDENFLMSIGTIGAFAIGKYAEAVMVMLLYQIGEWLQDRAVMRSKKAITNLLNIKAKVANLVTDDGEIQVDLDRVAVGSIIRIKPGENVPLDGIITFGTSNVNTSALTGESAEITKTIGDEILSGTINGEGVLLVKVTKNEKDSTVSKIIDMVESASMQKAKTENFISKFAKVYTPIVCLVAVLIAIVPCLFLGFGAFSTYLYRGLIFLVVSCPCALVISVPLSFFAGLGAAARKGVLVRGSNFLEALSRVDTVIFDKTGTLTQGEFKIDKITAFGENTQKDVLEYIAYAESYSNHRIARSVVESYLENNEINSAWIEDVTEHAGLGIEAKIFMNPVLVGSRLLLEQNGIKINGDAHGQTAIYLAVSGEHAGTITLSDTIKSDAKMAIRDLKNLGVKQVLMFTGDNEKVASAVAGELGLDGFHANMLPQDKVSRLAEYEKASKGLAFVGDGINDAPVLASVDVGVAMGGVGSDVAVEASDVVLMTDEPSKMVDAIKTARKTHKIVTENVTFALAIKLAVLALGAVGFAGMWLAIFADVGVSCLAVLNSLRAMK